MDPGAPLIVLLGAGASFDCASPDVEQSPPPPPLASQLFASDYNHVLADYPAAQMVATDLRKAGRLGNALAIEEFIRTRYRDSDHPLDRKKYATLPCYLQELLFTVSKAYLERSHPDNYDLLIAGVLKLPEVIFITLNYDTLLDDRLAVLDPLEEIDDYIAPDRRWSLVKLHGSVNWGRRVEDGGRLNFQNPDPDVSISEIIQLRNFGDLESHGYPMADSVRNGETFRPGTFYPAVSVPVGAEDELVCPPRHVSFLRAKLDTADPKHLLVIGYSANDREVIKLFQESKPVIESMLVVSDGEKGARQIAEKLRKEIGTPHTRVEVSDTTFGGFVHREGLDNYLASIA